MKKKKENNEDELHYIIKAKSNKWQKQLIQIQLCWNFKQYIFIVKKKKSKHLEISSEPLLTHRKYFLRQSNVTPFYSF